MYHCVPLRVSVEARMHYAYIQMNISSSAEFMRKLEGSLNGELGNFNDVVISTVNTIILY